MKKIFYLIALLGLVLSGCEKDNTLSVIEISTGESSNVTTNSATVSLTCNDATGLAYVGVICSRETTFEDASTVDLNTKTSSGGTFDFSLTGLMPGVTYYYKGYAIDRMNNRIYGIVKTFITESQSLSLSESMLTVLGSGETKQIQVTSNGAWTAASNQDWCKVLTVSGSDNGSMSFIVTKNDGTEERSAVITVTCGALSQTLTVVQQASSASLSVSTGSFSLTSGSGIYKFTVTSNTAWTVTCDQSWCTVTPVIGTGNAEVSFNVTANTSTIQRTANIVIFAGGVSQTIIVTQLGASSSLAVSSNNFTANASGESKSFTVTSNTNWTVTSNQSWCTVTPSTGSNNGTVTFTTAANTNTTQRTAIITVSTGASAQQITVVQDAKAETPTLNVSSTNFSLASTANSNTFTVTSNQNWTVSSNQSWCTVTPTSGDGSGTVTFSVTENTATALRTATITVKTTTGNITQTITVTQAGATAVVPTLSLSSTNFSVAATSGSNTFTITSNQSWTVSSNQTWCTVSPNSGSNSGTVTFSIAENTATTARTAIITVTAGSETKTISVIQAAAAITLSVSTNSFTLLVSGGSNKFTVTSNANWTVSSNQTWCVVSPQSGSNTGEVTFTASANTSADSRTATITITADEHTEHITVTQVGTSAPTQTLSVSSTSFSLAATNSSNTFTITSNQSWTVASNQSWCTVSPTSGSNNGTVAFGLAANTTTYPRTATITVSAGSTTQNITIAQAAAASTLSVSTGNFAMIAAAGNNTFTVTSNTNWTVSSNQTWCTVSPTSGSNTGTVAFSITANTAEESRSAVITIKAGTLTQQVAVSQLGASAVTPTLSVSSTSFSVAATANSNTFAITSNSNWTVASNQSWCTVSPASGSNNGTVTFSVVANTEAVPRTAMITVTAGTLTQTITITQAAFVPTLSVSQTSIIVDASSSSSAFNITSNTNWTVSSNQSWCTVSPTSGSNNGTVGYNITENTTYAVRTATLTITAGTLTQTISVTQMQQPILDLDPYATIEINVLDWHFVQQRGDVEYRSAQISKNDRKTIQTTIRSGSRDVAASTAETSLGSVGVYIYKLDASGSVPECAVYLSTGSFVLSGPNAGKFVATMKITSGQKKIFVACNIVENAAGADLVNHSGLGAVSSDMPLSFTLNNTLYSTGTGFGKGSITSLVPKVRADGLIKNLAMNDIYGVGYGWYSGSATQKPLMTNWDGPDDMDNAGGSATTFISTASFRLNPDIDSVSSQNQLASLDSNYVVINVQRAYAKISFKFENSLKTTGAVPTTPIGLSSQAYKAAVGLNSEGRFFPWGSGHNAYWSLGNIPTAELPFQGFDATSGTYVRDPFYRETNDSVSNPAHFTAWTQHYDNNRVFPMASLFSYPNRNLTVTGVKMTMLTAGNYTIMTDGAASVGAYNFAYCTENAREHPVSKDQQTYAIVGGFYQPKTVTTNIIRHVIPSNGIKSYTQSTNFTWIPTGASTDSLYYISDDMVFVYGRKALLAYYAWVQQKDFSAGGTPGGTIDAQTLTDADYTYDGDGNGISDVVDAINSDIDNGILYAYFQGQCWYRVYLYDDAETNTSKKVSVLRNHIYDVTINSIKGPGIEDPNKIIPISKIIYL